MKKIYSIAVILLIWANVSIGQILTTFHPTTDYNGPDTVKLTSHLDITNNGPNSLNVICQMHSRTMAPNHFSYFCWVVCYDTTITLSPSPIVIPAGGTFSGFEGWVGSGNTPGHSEVTYWYYDMNGLSDTLEITFKYDFESTIGIDEINASKYFMNITGQNPANNSTVVNYSIPPSSDAKLVVTNLLGSKVNEIRLSNKSNSLVVSVADLKSGVYVYSLMIDGIITSSKKLIVAHQ